MEPWKKTLYITWIAETIAMLGFSFVFPFLPFYIQELGIKDVGQVAIWAGLLTTAPALGLIVSAPIWGILADRFGRKIMVERAMLAGGILVILMGLAKNVQQLLWLRLIQGLFTGTITAAIALVASAIPRERSGFGLGLMQTSVFTGASIGPWIGGLAADFWGYKTSFFVAGAIIFTAGIMVLFGVKEKFISSEIPQKKEKRPRRKFSLQNNFLSILAILFLIQLAGTIVVPIFPLFVQKLSSLSAHLASTTGFILAVSGIVSAFAAVTIGKFSDKLDYKKILIFSVIFAGIFCIFQSFARNIGQLLWYRVAFGLAIGGVIPTVNAMINLNTPRKDVGKTFGISASISAAGAALGPIIGGVLASLFTIQVPFIFSGVLLLIVGMSAAFLTKFSRANTS